MNILTVDDERLLREVLTKEVGKVFPNASIKSFGDGKSLLEHVKRLAEDGEELDYAFLDIRLGNVSGIELARQIKNILPETKIIFCTGYSEYACEAFGVFAKGYILKPVTAESIEKTLDEMVLDWRTEKSDLPKDIRVKTFGNFEISVDDKPVEFKMEEARELLAYLVDRKGAAVTKQEIAGMLWPDSEYSLAIRNKTAKAVSSLNKTMKDYGIENILVKSRNHLSIDPQDIKCDAYDFFEGDSGAVNSYGGKYMVKYSWAEFTDGAMTQAFSRD